MTSVFALREPISDMEPNEMGMIPLLEYHQIGESEDRWVRSRENFRRDLEWLYVNDWRPVSMRSFLDQSINLPRGFKPFIFTFDDGSNTQIRVNDGIVDPNSAIGIMDLFLKEHPEFGSSAVFYINKNPFPQSDNSRFAISYLLDTGREIGNHTLHHAHLSDLTDEVVDVEVGGLNDVVQGMGFDVVLDHLAYPIGSVPSASGISVIQKYVKIGLLVGAEPSYTPYDRRFDAYRVPRIQAIDSEWKRWFSREAGFSGVNPQPPRFDPFVSDGQEHILTVSDVTLLDQLDRERIRSGLEIVVDERLPYQLCGYEDAGAFVDFKKESIIAQLYGMFTRQDWKVSFEVFLGHEYRRLLHVGDRRGIYLNAAYSGDEREDLMLKKIADSSVNFVVFDVVKTDIARSHKMLSLQHFVQKLHQNDIYSVARLVVAQDEEVVRRNPEWSIHYRDGRQWTDNKGYKWLDLTDRDVVKYIGDLSERVAELGVDEVQLDYIRYPTEGYLSLATYDRDFPILNSRDAVREVVREVRRRLIPYGVDLGVDYLGIVGWNNQHDSVGTGQSISCISPYVDAIYPMAYPSHFGPGFGGSRNPADEPRMFINKTTSYFQEFSRGTFTDIRTWLQGFDYRVSIPFNSHYISLQIDGVRDANADGFVIWNAQNNYGVTWTALVNLARRVKAEKVELSSIE